MYEEILFYFLSVWRDLTRSTKNDVLLRQLDFMIIGVLTLLTDFKKSSIHSQRLVFNRTSRGGELLFFFYEYVCVCLENLLKRGKKIR
jgi:hypothetical protein